MSSLGAVMASEIAQTPQVFRAILDNRHAFDAVKDVLTQEKIQSVLILARGTSNNAAHYLKYLIETQLGLTQVFIVTPSHMPPESITEALVKIRKTSSQIFWIGNGGAPEGNDIVLAGSDCDDEITSTN